MKTNIFKLMLIGLIGMLMLTGCGFNSTAFDLAPMTRIASSGNVVTETRNVNGFDGLVVNGAGRVLIDQTGTESLAITTDDNILPYIVTKVHDGKLIIEFKPQVAPHNLTALTFKLTIKELKSIKLNGATMVEGTNIDASQMTVAIGGASAVTLAGKVDELNVTLNGAGAYNSKNLECKRATVTNNGAGAAIVRVSDELNATINGMGLIEYIGKPKVTQGIRGIGVVSQR